MTCIRRLAIHLKERQPINEIAVALILTELRFRGVCFRLTEAIYATMYFLALGRDPKITVGMCQVSIQYWRRYCQSSGCIPPSIYFKAVANYDVCVAYLDAHPRDSMRDILIAYNGRPSTAYVAVFEEKLALVRKYLAKPEARFKRSLVA